VREGPVERLSADVQEGQVGAVSEGQFGSECREARLRGCVRVCEKGRLRAVSESQFGSECQVES
jgi:hypothetical protein